MEKQDVLLDEVKNYLDITWEDEATNEKTRGMILRSKAYLNDLTGSELDFDKQDIAKELLMIRVMYERSGALDDFRKNYLSELNSLVTRERVNRYAEKETGS